MLSENSEGNSFFCEDNKVSEQLCCIISIYRKTVVEELNSALHSIEEQTVKPACITIVVDGGIGEKLSQYLDVVSKKSIIRVIYLPMNLGPGAARHIGIVKSEFEFIAIMDSDDKSVTNRFELQLREFELDKNLHLCGGAINELDKRGNVISRREVPLVEKDIIERLKSKSPLNNVTVMFNRKAYLETGGYPFKRTSEDYHLWAKFICIGKKIKNIDSVLVEVKYDENALERRRGCSVYIDDFETQMYLLRNDMVSSLCFIRNIIIYAVYRFIPSKLRSYATKWFLR